MNLVAAMLLANACAFGGVLDNAWTKGTTDKNPLSCKHKHIMIYFVHMEATEPRYTVLKRQG